MRALYELAGFAHTGHTEIAYLARVDDLPRPATAPIAGMLATRSVGINGTRLSAVLDQDMIGYIELETADEGERTPRHGRWADVGNLRVSPGYRRRGVGTWLLGQAAGGCGWRTSTGCWTTPGWKGPTTSARTTRSTGHSCLLSASRS